MSDQQRDRDLALALAVCMRVDATADAIREARAEGRASMAREAAALADDYLGRSIALRKKLRELAGDTGLCSWCGLPEAEGPHGELQNAIAGAHVFAPATSAPPRDAASEPQPSERAQEMLARARQAATSEVQRHLREGREVYGRRDGEPVVVKPASDQARGEGERTAAQAAAKQSCNRHDDCDAADVRARAAGRFSAEHCHDECCEECFGN